MHFTKSIFYLPIFLLSCQGKTNIAATREANTIAEVTDSTIQSPVLADTTDYSLEGYLLALTSEGLQLVHEETGKTTDLPYGMPEEELIPILNTVLNEKTDPQLNSECGAGPLRIATWKNGLGVLLQESEAGDEWQFVGWSMDDRSADAGNLTTLSGIGIGSTRVAMEEVYAVEVSNTSLGNEFTTATGLFGIFNGPGKNAKITHMWSGVSCNFR
jgi:hypothetical protein